MSAPLDERERRALGRRARKATLDAIRALGGEAHRQDIREWALAHGGFTTRELAAPAPEAAKGKYEDAVDHQLSWALTNLKRDGLVAKWRWGIWKLTDAAIEPAASALPERIQAGRLAQLRAMSYARYLMTPEWRRTRAAALQRAGNCCSLDATHTDRLEVHHNTYERLGAELSTDLVVLCHSCHQLHHREDEPGSREISIASPLPPVMQEVFSTPTLVLARPRRPSPLSWLWARLVSVGSRSGPRASA